MKNIEVKIKEKDKKGKHLTLLNFRDELVNFMYKKTVADSSRSSMQFFVLVFFISLKIDNKSLLMKVFDENIDNLKKLNKAFDGKKRLKKGEYNTFVKENKLDKIFKYDIFFILITTILDFKSILNKFNDYFSENENTKDDFLEVVKKYKENLEGFDLDFKKHLITDDRYDEFGEYHDLSKSIYRTIKMRTSRQIDLSLHKYAEVKIISSQSPIDLSIIQHIDPQVIFDLWETYKLGDYVKAIWNFTNQPLPAGGIILLADRWLKWKSIDGQKKRKEKKKAKIEFDIAKNDKKQNEQLLQLATVLAESVVKSNDYLKKEIDELKEKAKLLSESKGTLSDKEGKKEVEILKEKIERLENIDISTKENKS